MRRQWERRRNDSDNTPAAAKPAILLRRPGNRAKARRPAVSPTGPPSPSSTNAVPATTSATAHTRLGGQAEPLAIA